MSFIVGVSKPNELTERFFGPFNTEAQADLFDTHIHGISSGLGVEVNTQKIELHDPEELTRRPKRRRIRKNGDPDLKLVQ